VRTDDFDIEAKSSDISAVSDDVFPSGPWIGSYTYTGDRDRHRMDLALDFGNGTITGEGNDDIGAFVVCGRYDAGNRECHWTKKYVAAHDVYYRGFREGGGIWGVWEVGKATGGFKVWPLASGESGGEEENVERAETVGTMVGAGLGTGEFLTRWPSHHSQG
jgi:hypothetical protein